MEPRKGLAIGLAGSALFIGAFLFYQSRQAPPPAPPVAEPAPAPQAPAAPPAPPLPPLEQSDALAREKLAAAMPGAPKEWLEADSPLRRFTAAVHILAEGKSPRDALRFMRPTGRFKVLKKGGRLYADPASYARYDAAAGALASLDARAAAKAVRDLKPLLQQACGELDDRCDVQAELLKALQPLVDAPVPEKPPVLRAKVVSYAYADPALEDLTPAQKHLLRMGPDNQRKVQAKLRELADALRAP